jgi:hypothetical protein
MAEGTPVKIASERKRPIAFHVQQSRAGELIMRSIILYVLGVPLTIIVLIAIFTHHF